MNSKLSFCSDQPVRKELNVPKIRVAKNCPNIRSDIAIRVVERDFSLRINILQDNHCILRIGLIRASEVFKNQSYKSQLFSSSHSPI